MNQADVHAWATALIDAWQYRAAKPVYAQRYPKMCLDDAYQVQHEYVAMRLHNDQIAGFKAAMTAPDAAGKFNPIGGVLFASGTLHNDVDFDAGALTRAMLETEIGFVAGETVRESLDPGTDPLALMAGIVPMFEFADAGFDEPARMRMYDVVASNAVASHQLAGSAPGRELDPEHN